MLGRLAREINTLDAAYLPAAEAVACRPMLWASPRKQLETNTNRASRMMG
jgi:hypothetical protein